MAIQIPTVIIFYIESAVIWWWIHHLSETHLKIVGLCIPTANHTFLVNSKTFIHIYIYIHTYIIYIYRICIRSCVSTILVKSPFFPMFAALIHIFPDGSLPVFSSIATMLESVQFIWRFPIIFGGPPKSSNFDFPWYTIHCSMGYLLVNVYIAIENGRKWQLIYRTYGFCDFPVRKLSTFTRVYLGYFKAISYTHCSMG